LGGDRERVLVRWDEGQRALTPGQVCAFYDGEVLLGGGFFEEVVAEGDPDPE
jgi:tRNA-specific 2-thiouridylase